MKKTFWKRIIAFCLILIMLSVNGMTNVAAATNSDTALESALAEAKTYTDGLTINNSSNDPATVVSTFKKHFTWDNEKRENSKSYLFDWSYYNGVVFEGLEFLYEVTGEKVYKDYVIEYMSSLIKSNGTWATCSNNTSKQCAGYNSTHGADCYKTASLLLDAYEMTNDSRYLTMAKTLYADLDTAASKYSLKNAGNNYRHTWATDPSPDLWLDGLYMILPFRAEYAKYIGDTEELDLIVDRMQWVSDNMYNKSKGLFYHAADNASSNSGTYWLRSIGWYAAAIVDIMDSMDGENLTAMKAQLVKLVDGMKAVQNASNGMWLNNMNASKSSTNPYETSGTALVCYAVMKAVNEGWLDDSYADMAILAFKGICNEKLNGSTLTDICFKGAPGSSNSTFYNNEGKGVGPFIMFYAEVLEYVNAQEEHVHDWQVTEEIAATCENAGSVTTTCEGCGEAVVETMTALGHEYTTTTVEATCETAGSVTTTCTRCDYEVVEVQEALGHNYKTVTVVATCETAGSVTTTCTRCDYETVEAINALGHNYKTVTVEPTCEKDGSITTTCTNCGDASVEVLPAFGHSYDSVTTEATCTTDGGTTHTCIVCGDSYTENYVAAFGHNYETVTVEPTCTEKGSNTHTCTNCGKTTIDVLEALGHENETVSVEATCETDGSVTTTCRRCGYETVEVIEAFGHNYKTVSVEATCTKNGSVTTTCGNCGDSKVEVIPALGHNYVSVITDATCENAGYTTHTCTECGGTYTTDHVAAFGHNYETVTVEATCTADSSVTTTCANCGDSTVEVLKATGHAYTSVESGNNMVYTCGNCGHSYTESIAVEYEYAKVNAFTEGSKHVITLYSGRKYYAVTHANNTLGVKQVTVSNNKITSEITDDMLWTYEGSKLSYKDGDSTYYLYVKSSSNNWWGSWWGSTSYTLSVSTSNSSTVSLSSNKLKVGSAYLRYSNGTVSANSSATTSYIYKQNVK